jgi:hypothetical protein
MEKRLDWVGTGQQGFFGRLKLDGSTGIFLWIVTYCNLTIHNTLDIICTLWLFNIAMENDPLIDGLPITNGDFPWLC